MARLQATTTRLLPMTVTLTEHRSRRHEPTSRPPRPVKILDVTILDPTTARIRRCKIRMAGFRLLDLVETPAMTSASTPIAMVTIRILLPTLVVATPQKPTIGTLQPAHSEAAAWILETTQISPTMSSTRNGRRPVTIRMICRAVTLTPLCRIVLVKFLNAIKSQSTGISLMSSACR